MYLKKKDWPLKLLMNVHAPLSSNVIVCCSNSKRIEKKKTQRHLFVIFTKCKYSIIQILNQKICHFQYLKDITAHSNSIVHYIRKINKVEVRILMSKCIAQIISFNHNDLSKFNDGL